MTIACTYTKTYALMHPWAQTIPVPSDWQDYAKAAREGDPCCASQCDERLVVDEVVYAVIELDREDANPGRNEPWVCWRHVHPDDGPSKVIP